MGSCCVLVFPKLSSIFFLGPDLVSGVVVFWLGLKQALIVDMPIIQSYP